MASGVKVWLGIVLVGMVGMTVLALPPRSMEDWLQGRLGISDRWVAPETRAFQEVSAEVRYLGATYQYLQWEDSLRTLARSRVMARRGWTVVGPGPSMKSFSEDATSTEWDQRLNEAVAAQLAALGVRAPAEPVGVVVMDASFGLFPGYPWRSGTRGWLIFVDDSAEASSCFLVQPENPAFLIQSDLERLAWTDDHSKPAPNPLGPCAIHAKYGSPGAGISRWLRGGGYVYGEAGLSRKIAGDPLGWYTESRRFGVRWHPHLSPAAAACLAGRREACRTVFLHPFADDTPYRSYAGGRAYGRPPVPSLAYQSRRVYEQRVFGGAEGELVSVLEAEFGPERFSAFWSSESEVTEAFRTAFGIPVEDWVQDWARKRWEDLESGPAVPVRAGLLSLLTLGVLAGGAVLMDRKRRFNGS